MPDNVELQRSDLGELRRAWLLHDTALRIIGGSVLCRLSRARDSRHSFASHLVMRGVAIRAVQELMGHASIVITQRYAHLAPHVSQDAVRLLDAPGERPMAKRSAQEQAPKLTSERSAEKLRRTSRTERPAERTVAKKWQETRPDPLSN